MKTISLKTAKAIAADWHGGQGSALYSFASTGMIDPAAGSHLAEIDAELNSNGILKRQKSRLEKLKQFIKVNTNRHG
jgi:hypothetical protein